MSEKPKLGQILVKSGAISLKDLESFLKNQEDLRDERGYQTKLGDLLLENKLVTEATLAMAFAEQQGVKFVDLSKFSPDLSVLEKIPFSILNRFRFVPMFLDSQRLVVALHDPVDTFLLDLLYKALERTIELQSATRSQIENAHRACLDAVKRAGKENHDFDINFEEYRLILEQEKETKEVVEKPEFSQRNTLNELSLEGILKQFVLEQKYTALKFYPNQAEVTVFGRSAYGFTYFGHFSLEKFRALWIKIKSLAGLPEEEPAYLSQAWFEVHYPDIAAQTFQVTFFPGRHGLELMVELYSLDRRSLSLSRLGFLEADLMRISNPAGDTRGVLVLGSEQSGRTTTLLALMNQSGHLPAQQILLEDKPTQPVGTRTHVTLDGHYSQTDGIGYAVAAGAEILGIDPLIAEKLPAVLRQCQGRTLYVSHTAPPILPFLAQMEKAGVALGQILTSFRVILHQKLVPLVCPWCSALTPYPAEHLAKMGVKPETLKKPLFYVPAGCDYCEHRGYSEMTLVYEMLHVTPATAKLLMENPISSELALNLMKAGSLGATNNVARDKLYRGLISLETYVALLQRKL